MHKLPSLTAAVSALIAVMSTKGRWGLMSFDRNKASQAMSQYGLLGGWRRGFSSPLIQAFKKTPMSTGTSNLLNDLDNTDAATFAAIKANANGERADMFGQAKYAGADMANLNKYIDKMSSATQVTAAYRSEVANVTPIMAGFKNVMGGFGSVLSSFVSGLVNFGITMAITMTIQGIAKLIDYINVTEQEMIQAGQKAKDVIDSTRKGVQKQAEVLKKVEDSDFDSLMRGVDTDTNENISLTESQYQNYIQLCNEIAEVYPEVVASYDAQGNAILTLGDNAGTAAEQLKTLLDIDKQLAGISIAENLQDRFMGIKAEAIGKDGNGGIQAKINEDNKTINQAQRIIDQYAQATAEQGLQTENTGLAEDIIKQFKENERTGKEYLDLTAYSTQVQGAVSRFLMDNGIWDSQLQLNSNPYKKQQYGQGKIHYHKGSLTPELQKQLAEYVQSAQPVSSVNQEELRKELQKAQSKRTEGEQKKAAHTKELDAKWKELVPDVKSAIENNPNFSLLSEQIQNELLDTVGNIDIQSLPDEVMNGDVKLIDWLQDQYLYPVSIAFDKSIYDTPQIRQAKESAQEAFTKILAFDPEKMTGAEYYNTVNKYKDVLKNYFTDVLNDQDGSQFNEFMNKYVNEKLGLSNAITQALGLEGEEKGKSTKKLQKLTMEQLKQVADIVSDPKFGGTLREAINKVTKEAKIESVTLSDILGSPDEDDSIISQAQNLKTVSSAINEYKQTINKGEFSKSDFSKLISEYPQLAKDTELLNEVMNSFNPSGFLEGTDALNEALSDIQVEKLESFRKKFAEEYSLIEDETQKQAARNYYQSVIDGMIPKDISVQSVSDYLDQVAAKTGLTGMHFESQQYRTLKQTLKAENGAQLVMRILADPSLAEMSVEQLVQQIQDTKAEIQVEVNEQAVKNSISLIQNLGSGNKSVKDFETNLQGGTATFDDFLGILSDYPQIVGSAEDSISDLVNTMDFSGRLDDVQGIQQILGKIKVDNLQETINQILGNQNLNPQQKTLMRQMAFTNADLSGISARDAANIVKTYAAGNTELTKMAVSQNDLEREAAATAAGLGISFEQAFDKAKAKADQLNISAVQSFQSMADEVSSFGEKVASGEATSGDILGLVETFPDLLKETLAR